RRAPGNVVNTGSRGNQSYGNVTTATGKKVICYNCRGEGHVARQCKEPKRACNTLKSEHAAECLNIRGRYIIGSIAQDLRTTTKRVV
ncbi:reverse transcriptase domain-containing protein, partial [Tanacetum coccineum]